MSEELEELEYLFARLDYEESKPDREAEDSLDQLDVEVRMEGILGERNHGYFACLLSHNLYDEAVNLVREIEDRETYSADSSAEVEA